MRSGPSPSGKRADLILADANPLQNLGNMEKRSGVMVARALAARLGDRRPARKDCCYEMRRLMEAYPLARRDILTLAGLASISPFALDVGAGAEPRAAPSPMPAGASSTR